MKKRFSQTVILFLVLLFSTFGLKAADWRFPIHLNYVGGLNEVFDLYKNNMEQEGYTVISEFVMPVGISFNPYLQFDSGLRIGGGLGPIFLVLIEENGYFALPLNINSGYTLFPNGPFSPYIKGGLSYHLAGGAYYHSSTPGLYAAAGVVLMNNRKVNFGFEVSTDLSKVKFENGEIDYYDPYTGYPMSYGSRYKSLQPGKLVIGLFVQF